MVPNSARFWKVRPIPSRAMSWELGLEEVAILERDGAGGWLVEPAQAVEKRGLARAIEADEPHDLPGLDVEGDVVERHDAAEAHAQVTHLQYRQLCRLSWELTLWIESFAPRLWGQRGLVGEYIRRLGPPEASKPASIQRTLRHPRHR